MIERLPAMPFWTESERQLVAFLEGWMHISPRTARRPDTKEPFRFFSMGELVRRHGQSMVVHAVSSRERGTPKECFWNAMFRAMDDPSRYSYAEGYAASAIPVHHAWIVDNACECGLEVTWLKPGPAYFGIVFKAEYVLETWGRWLRSETQNVSLIDAWEEDFPLLSGKHRIEDVTHPAWPPLT